MWVVKLGGSLNRDPLLLQWLGLLARLGGGRVTVVCGGGEFADEVRRAQAHWRFDDLNAHNMAVLAMAQSAYMAQGLAPELRLATAPAEILQVLHSGHTALWLPLDRTSTQVLPWTNWGHSADSLALDLAIALNAERMVLVKSCAIPPDRSLAERVDDGLLDAHFASTAQRAAFPIDLVHKSDLAAMRELLQGRHWALGDAAPGDAATGTAEIGRAHV